MFFLRKSCYVVIAFLAAVTLAPLSANAEETTREPGDSIKFLNLFHVGMSYDEVRLALPKDVHIDVPSYNVSDHTFMLAVETSEDRWSAYFLFDTTETTVRRPERVVEIGCSTTVDGSSQTFESIVNKVSGTFGDPVNLEQSRTMVRDAGWRVSNGSILTLEYSRMPSESRVLVDFVVKATRPGKSVRQVARGSFQQNFIGHNIFGICSS
jgi:hypothetical protein